MLVSDRGYRSEPESVKINEISGTTVICVLLFSAGLLTCCALHIIINTPGLYGYIHLIISILYFVSVHGSNSSLLRRLLRVG